MEKKNKEKVYIINNENVMKKWNYIKNFQNGLDPQKITCGSHLYADFVCPDCGHEWRGMIKNDVKYNGCSVCMKKARSVSNTKTRLQRGKPLSITNPELVAEWNFEENDKLQLYPDRVMAGTNKKAHWICHKCSTKYVAYISNRALKKSGCPVCSNQKVLTGYNDLLTINPDLVQEWDYEKNDEIGIFPDELTIGSNIKVNWICPLGHQYLQAVKTRSSGQGCPICSNELQTSFPEQAILFYIKKVFGDAVNRYLLDEKYEIDIYIPSINVGIEYDGAYYHKNKSKRDKIKEIYIQEKGVDLIKIIELPKREKTYIQNNVIYIFADGKYEYLKTVIGWILEKLGKNNLIEINIEKDRIKIYEQYIFLKKQNSIATLMPQLLEEWDYEKNGKIKPQYVSIGSTKKYYWLCSLNHSYVASPKHRKYGTGCPICAGKKVLKGFNDFESYAQKNNKTLLLEWDYEKNIGIDISQLYYSSTKKFNWTCAKCHHDYKTSLGVRIRGIGCPYCAGKKVDSEESFAAKNPELLEEWNYDKNNINPYQITMNSNKLVYWTCSKCGYTYKASVVSRAVKRTGCQKCSIIFSKRNANLSRVQKRGSLSEKYPNIAKEWNYDKNNMLEITPESITSGSGKIVWWKCSKCGYEWQDTINVRSHGKKCPKCKKGNT